MGQSREESWSLGGPCSLLSCPLSAGPFLLLNYYYYTVNCESHDIEILTMEEYTVELSEWRISLSLRCCYGNCNGIVINYRPITVAPSEPRGVHMEIRRNLFQQGIGYRERMHRTATTTEHCTVLLVNKSLPAYTACMNNYPFKNTHTHRKRFRQT